MPDKNYLRVYPLSAKHPDAKVEYFASTGGPDTPIADRMAGRLNENGYTARYYTRFNGPVDIYLSPAAPFYGDSMVGLGAVTLFDPVAVPSNIKAYANLLEKYKQSDFNLAVTAGESRESWHMISDRMFSIASAARNVKRGDLRGALRALGSTRKPSRRAQRKLDSGDVSGSFLELNYGWLPLLSDIYSASEVINKPYVSHPSLRTSDRVKGPPVRVSDSRWSGKQWEKEYERTIYHITRLSSKEVSMAVRLGLTDPLTILWELTPFSFVYDWFMPIGDMLSAIQAMYVIPVGKYIRTDALRYHAGVTIPSGTFVPGMYPTTHTTSAGTYWIKGITMTRTVYDALPDQLYQGTGPRQSLIDLDLSLRQVASASALVHQGLRSLVRR